MANSINSFNINSLRKYDYHCSYSSMIKAIQGTKFKYAPYREFQDRDMLKFFELYNKYPLIEHLSKVGLSYLVKQKLEKNTFLRPINWRGKDIYKMLKIDRKDLRDIRAANIVVDHMFLILYQMQKKQKQNLTPQQVKELQYLISYNFIVFEEMLKHTSVRKAFKYLKKQSQIEHKGRYSNLLQTWKDYMRDCEKLEMDTTNYSVVFPKDLHTAHQNTIKQIKYNEDKALNESIAKRMKVLNKYYYENNGLFIRPARSSKELIEEGKKLNHCVGGYVKSYAEGTTNLFFIRREEEPDTPFYTLEFKGKLIVQVRGEKNCKPTYEVEKFVEQFRLKKLVNKKAVRKVKIAV